MFSQVWLKLVLETYKYTQYIIPELMAHDKAHEFEVVLIQHTLWERRNKQNANLSLVLGGGLGLDGGRQRLGGLPLGTAGRVVERQVDRSRAAPPPSHLLPPLLADPTTAPCAHAVSRPGRVLPPPSHGAFVLPQLRLDLQQLEQLHHSAHLCRLKKNRNSIKLHCMKTESLITPMLCTALCNLRSVLFWMLS